MQLTFEKFVANLCCIDNKLLASFQATQQEFAPVESPPCIVMADLARATVDSLREFTVQQRAEIFRVIEEGLREGDESTKDAIATGFLETLQSELLKSPLLASEVYNLLQTESKKYCLEWDRVNGINSPGLDKL